jgi:hypothetical protein
VWADDEELAKFELLLFSAGSDDDIAIVLHLFGLSQVVLMQSGRWIWMEVTVCC